MNNSIIPFTHLKEDDVEEIIPFRKGNISYYQVILKNRGGFCPKCSMFTKSVKGYYSTKINHSIFQCESCTIIYRRRRLVCNNCSTSFYERNPFIEDYDQISNATVHNCLTLLKDYNETFASVARKVNLSKTYVMKIFDEHVQIKRHSFSEVMCVDEIYFSKHSEYKYSLVIMNFKNALIIDLLPSRHKHRISSYLSSIPLAERSKVRYLCIDMNPSYLDVFSLYLPNTTICIDSFHVVKTFQKVVDDIRLQVLRRYKDDMKSDQYYLLKHQRKLLFSNIIDDSYSETKYNHHFRYKVTDRRKLEMLLSIDPRLKEAYNIKERYIYFNRNCKTYEEALVTLEQIENDCLTSNISEINSLGRMIHNWNTYIANSFLIVNQRRVSNGPIEGRNKYLKLILNLANGYSNFNRFRNRAMYVLNKHEKYSEELLENNIKRRNN